MSTSAFIFFILYVKPIRSLYWSNVHQRDHRSGCLLKRFTVFLYTHSFLLYFRNYIPTYMEFPIPFKLACNVVRRLVNSTEIVAPKQIARTHHASVSLCRWMLKLEEQIFFTELLNPSFSNKFVFNQWLPYFSLSPGPYACDLRKIAWLLSFIASQLQRIIFHFVMMESTISAT